MLSVRDFVPMYAVKEGMFGRESETAETFEDAVARASTFIDRPEIKLVQLETVVLPNMWEEDGAQDVALRVGDRAMSTLHARWHQFVRVWYRVVEPSTSPYR